MQSDTVRDTKEGLDTFILGAGLGEPGKVLLLEEVMASRLGRMSRGPAT